VGDYGMETAVRMKRTSDRWYLVAFALIATTAGTPEAARAQASIEGRYGFVAAESADVRQAIREATADANFFVRNVGRGVLQRALRPPEILEIVLDDEDVAITAEDGSLLRSHVDGRTIEVRNARGERESVETAWEGDTLLRSFRADKASREFRYVPDPDGRTLRVQLDVSGSVLPRPIRYTHTYRRITDRS
jgi:hypothetical protein